MRRVLLAIFASVAVAACGGAEDTDMTEDMAPPPPATAPADTGMMMDTTADTMAAPTGM
jgi:hypothetical protein